MPEMRHDALTDRVVLVAPERAARPHTFRHELPALPRAVADCPFCEGNERLTPPEVARLGSGAPDTPGWQTRVVPNKFPLVGGAVAGVHEVVIFSTAHDCGFADLDRAAALACFALLRDRCRTHAESGYPMAHVFINEGRAAGASIEHPHAQIVALDSVPPAAAAELARWTAAARELLADDLALATELDLVVGAGPAAAWCPFSAAAPFETLIAHQSARSCFADDVDDVIAATAEQLWHVLRSLRAALGGVAYNVVIHTGPTGVETPTRWYVRVTPRLTTPAGFEFASGILVNTLPPEVAAATLRSVGRA